jgi:PEP-CTERM motif
MIKFLKTAIAAAAVVSAGLASAETFNFTTLAPTNGTACFGSDRCGQPLTFTMGTLTATVTASYFGNTTGAVQVVQDSGGSPMVGLGVYHTTNTSDDNLTYGELLTIDFGQDVTLTGLNFRADGHGVFSATGKKFLLNGDSTSLAGTVGDLSRTGRTFTFGYGGASDDISHQYYLSGMTVTAVPEPETLAMMLAGLGLVGSIARRRKANQA